MAEQSVVVGATGSVGRAVVARLAADGHAVLAIARSEGPLADLAEELPRVRTATADCTSEDFEAIVADALAGDRVRTLVHTAAPPFGGDVLTVEPEVVLAAVDVKVNGLLRGVRAVEQALRSGSSIVAIGGNLGFDPVPSASTGGIANAAQASVVRQLSRALGPRGVSCHVVAPGPLDTPRFRDMIARQAAEHGVDVAEALEEARAQRPLGRLTAPADVAWAVARLCDPEAAALTGGALILDMGQRTGLP